MSIVGQALTNPVTKIHYKLEKLIGSGNSAKVYSARSSHSNESVAIKIFPSSDQASYQRERRAYELASAKPACYSSILCLQDFFVLPSTHEGVLILELVDTDLAQTVVPHQDIPKLVHALIQAITHLHDLGLVHCDINLHNVYRRGSMYKLGDLSLVCSRHAILGLPSCRQLIETNRSLSPYQRQDQAFAREMDSDVFQLGQVLASVVFNFYPTSYVDISPKEPYPYPEPPEISGQALIMLIRHMLHPSDRWTSSQLRAYIKDNFQPTASN